MVYIRQLVTEKNQYLIFKDAAFISAAITVSQTVIQTREIYILCFWGPSPCFVLCGISIGAVSTREGRASEVSVWVRFFLSFFFFKIYFTLCMHTFLCLCGCLWRPEENVESFETGFQMFLRCPMWVLRSKFQFSDRTVPALNS